MFNKLIKFMNKNKVYYFEGCCYNNKDFHVTFFDNCNEDTKIDICYKNKTFCVIIIVDGYEPMEFICKTIKDIETKLI